MADPVTLPGNGTQFKLAAAAVAQVLSMDGPEISVESIDTTNLSTTGGMTKRPSIIYDPGNISLTLQYNPKDASHAAILALLLPTPTSGSMSIVFTDGTIYAFTGFPSKWKVTNIESQENVEADVEIEISGNITVTPGT
jgi:hypothetical protein